MDWNCLIIDLNSRKDPEELQSQLEGLDLPLDYQVVTTADEAIVAMSTGGVAMMCIFTNDLGNDLHLILTAFNENVGCLPDSQMIVIDDPEPNFLTGIFEYGVEQLAGHDAWGGQLLELCSRIAFAMSDENSTEFKNIQLTAAIQSGDQQKIKEISSSISEAALTDFRIAYARARAMEAMGKFTEAAKSYQSSSEMNKLYRKSQTKHGQTLMLQGKTDEAILIYEKLQRTNSSDVNRLADLASAYIEKGDFEKANEFLANGQKIAEDHPKIKEARAQMLLSQGKIGEAFKLMDELEEVGPFFAVKLNELGIKLSQAGKGKSALALYQKAHKIVRAELKYKITLNCALACRRLQEYDMALKYAQRCRREFSSDFEKLAKIEAGLKDRIAKKNNIQDGAA